MEADRRDRAHPAAVRAAGREHGSQEAAVAGAAAPPPRLHLRLGRIPRSIARVVFGPLWSAAAVVVVGVVGGCLDRCFELEPITFTIIYISPFPCGGWCLGGAEGGGGYFALFWGAP